MAFEVYDRNGNKLEIGDEITDSRGDLATFGGCRHPRKIMTDRLGCERNPSAFNVEIRGTGEDEGYIWSPVSDEGRRLAALVDNS